MVCRHRVGRHGHRREHPDHRCARCPVDPRAAARREPAALSRRTKGGVYRHVIDPLAAQGRRRGASVGLAAGGLLAAALRTGRATSPHPALHEHNERSLARAAGAEREVPAAFVQRRADVHRRTPPVQSCRVLTGPLRPVDGSPALPGGALLTRLLRVLRHARGGNGGRCACPEPTNPGSAGTAGTLPTFTHMPVGRVGAQLYPGDVATRYRNPARGLTARPESGRARRPSASTRTKHPDSP
jgi:hypothetical protein